MTELVGARNPNWTRDELILALDLYRQYQGNPPGKDSQQVIALSKLLALSKLHVISGQDRN